MYFAFSPKVDGSLGSGRATSGWQLEAEQMKW
jgi:hypothetical protein